MMWFINLCIVMLILAVGVSCNSNNQESNQEESKVDSNNLNDSTANESNMKSVDTFNKAFKKDSTKHENDKNDAIEKAKTELKRHLASLHSKGYQVVPVKNWSYRYKLRFSSNHSSKDFNIYHKRIDNKILLEKGKWGCFDTNDQHQKIKIHSKKILSAVIKDQKVDGNYNPSFKIIMFLFNFKDELKSEKNSLNCIKSYFIKTDGLKSPTEMIYQANKAFLVTSKSILFFSKWGETLTSVFTK